MWWSSVKSRVVLAGVIGCGWTGLLAAAPLLNEPVLPVPVCAGVNADKSLLGKRLFHDFRLSMNNTMSCATCHPLDQWGMDGLSRNVRADDSRATMHTPTVYNAAFNIAQFWNGRAITLEEQVDEAVRVDLGSNWNDVVRKLSLDADYRQDFARLYRGGIQAVNIRDALATFERSLITPNSRFDRYLRGEEEALTRQEKQGYALFKGLGCVSCHQGINLGGNLFHRFGLLQRIGPEGTDDESGELDRFAFTRNPEDQGVFKVPGLRNVARTAPYFHHGQVATLEEAVTLMARGQLGRRLTMGERDLLVAFLRSLDGMPGGECP
ncbi:MAG: c-type cytochrome [Magnetococcales bacterium]|nr:c-type cytochrome [Magnetococcales bacterium]